jgi:Fe-S-cluster-containing dehydrogenase component
MQMEKMILVDYTKCTGCRLCETVCSVTNVGACNPARARIKVIRWEWEHEFHIPTLCQQCEEAACIVVCPVKALSRDSGLGVVKLNSTLCIGCKLCLQACPFGAISYDFLKKELIKCQFCDGDPACVKFCETKALQFVDVSDANLRKKRTLGGQVLMAIGRAEEAL